MVAYLMNTLICDLTKYDKAEFVCEEQIKEALP